MSAAALNSFEYDKIALKHMGRIVIIAKRSFFARMECTPNCRAHSLIASSEMSIRMKLNRVLQGHGNLQKLQAWWVQSHHMLRSTRQDRIIDEIAQGGGGFAYGVIEIEDVGRSTSGALPTMQAVPIGDTTGHIGSLGINEKFTLVLQRCPNYMRGEFKSEFSKLLDPAAIGATVAVLGIVVFGGSLLSGIVLAIGFAIAGWSIFKAVGNILDFVVLTKNATSEQELNQAAQKLATAIAQLGVGTLIAILTRGAHKIGVGRRQQRQEQEKTDTETVQKTEQPIDPNNKSTKSETLKQNKEKGDAFEKEIIDQKKKEFSEVGEQVTIKTESDTKTRVDILTKSKDGEIGCIECKSSDTAPLTKNQKIAFPEIEKSGGTVVGKGKPGFEGGTKIPPTKVEIIRPPKE